MTFKPNATGAGNKFTYPSLVEGVEGKVVRQRFEDMDLVTVPMATVMLRPSGGVGAGWYAMLGLAVAAAAAGYWYWRREQGALVPVGPMIEVKRPVRVTPLSAILTLQRIEQEHADRLGTERTERLRTEIAELQRTHFGEQTGTDGPNERVPQDGLDQAMNRWIRELASADGGTG